MITGTDASASSGRRMGARKAMLRSQVRKPTACALSDQLLLIHLPAPPHPRHVPPVQVVAQGDAEVVARLQQHVVDAAEAAARRDFGDELLHRLLVCLAESP